MDLKDLIQCTGFDAGNAGLKIMQAQLIIPRKLHNRLLN